MWNVKTKLDFLKGKTILVTGGTGSFGKNFIRLLADKSKLKKIIVFSRDELKQSVMQAEFKNDPRLRFFLGDVRDLRRLERAFHGVDIVVHAAALKQVPALEYNPFEAVQTNILGTQNVLDAAINTGVKKLLFISSDKAAHPVNLYGASKLCAERLIVAGNAYSGGSTQSSCVRYGNVVGSRGSIVDVLLRNKHKKEVYITDERMTRFWLGLEEAFDLVLFALQKMEGGEIFIPKAPSMTVKDLFENIVPNAKRKTIGIRPGEKLHEILLTRDEARHSIDLGDYYVVLPEHETAPNQVKMKKYHATGKKVHPEFAFESHTNTKKLSNKDLMVIVEKMAAILE